MPTGNSWTPRHCEAAGFGTPLTGMASLFRPALPFPGVCPLYTGGTRRAARPRAVATLAGTRSRPTLPRCPPAHPSAGCHCCTSCWVATLPPPHLRTGPFWPRGFCGHPHGLRHGHAFYCFFTSLRLPRCCLFHLLHIPCSFAFRWMLRAGTTTRASTASASIRLDCPVWGGGRNIRTLRFLVWVGCGGKTRQGSNGTRPRLPGEPGGAHPCGRAERCLEAATSRSLWTPALVVFAVTLVPTRTATARPDSQAFGDNLLLLR